MALDPEGGAALPTKKKKRKPQAVPVMGEQATGGAKVPAARRIPDEGTQVGREPYLGSTNPAFQRMGFSGDIFTFNRRAETAATAYESVFGYQPSPALLLDLVRGPVQTEEYEDLFQIPQSFQRARALASTKDDPGTGVDRSLSEQEEALAAAESGPRGTLDTAAPLQTSGITDELGLPGLAARQIGEALFLSPLGIYEMGKAVTLDAKDSPSLIEIIKGEREGLIPRRSVQVGKEVAAGVRETYSNPAENPGFIFLDVLGLGSLGAGSAARVGRAGRLAREGKAKRDVVKALVQRPPPQRGQLRVGDLVVEKNLSDSALWRSAQRLRLRYLQFRIDINRLELESGFQREFTRPQREIRKAVSPEATVRRLDKQRRMTERVIDDTLRRELLAVAGPSVETSHVVKRLPRQIRRSLTRGEHKALFVHASDLPGDFFEKSVAWRRFHENQIAKAEEGAKGIDVKSQQRHLRDLTLAERAMEKPRKRFEKALTLSREVSETQEMIKLKKLGLDADDAETRIASLGSLVRGEISPADLEAGIPRMKKVIPESFYTPTIPRSKAKKPVASSPQMRAGEFGVAAPRLDVPELKHRFEGKAIYSGDIRLDTPHLLADTYGRTVRASARLSQFDDLWKASVPKQVGENYVALLPKGLWPDEIRAKVREGDAGAIVGKELDALSEKELNAFWNDVVLDPKRATGIPGVRWVDEALIPEHVYYPKAVRYFALMGAAINEPIKAARLFLVPRYMLNALGNVGMNMIETAAAPRHITRAVAMEKNNRKVARTVSALMGEGKMVALNPMDFSVQKWSHAMSRVWGAVTDRNFRNANFYYWAERKGYKTDEDVERLMAQDAPENVRKDLAEITERANKGMVDFRNLSPIERNVIRHWVFVYPWVSRSFVWGMRTMFEHPLKTWTAAELGRVGAERAEKFHKELGEEQGTGDPKFPEWARVEKGGYFPVSANAAGLPEVINFNSVNTFATLNDFLSLGKSLVEESPYDGPDDYLSPVAELGIHFFSGKDSMGQRFETGRLQGAFGEAFRGIPHVRAVEKFYEEDVEPDENPLKRPVFIPGFNNTWGSSLAGGLIKQTVDLEAMEARYWRDNPEEKQAKTEEDRIREKNLLIRDEIRTLRGFEQVHEQILGRKTPEDVRVSLRWQEKFTYDYAKYAIEVGREPTPAEKREIEIDRLFQDGRINLETQLQLKKKLGAAAVAFAPSDFIEASDLSKWTKQFRVDYLNAEEVADWYDDRNIVLDIAGNAPKHFRFLKGAGLWDGQVHGRPKLTKKSLPSSMGVKRTAVNPSQGYNLDDPLYEYGRKYVEYDHAATRRAEIPVERSSLETLRTAEQRAWSDEQDKEVVIEGKKFPSFVRMDWAEKSDDARLTAYSSLVTAGWETLSDFEKEIAGRKPVKGTSRGWLAYQAITDGLRGNVTPEDVTDQEIASSIPEQMDGDVEEFIRRDVAKFVDKTFAPGFYKDYLFSVRPKYQRLQVLPVVTKSKASKAWSAIFSEAEVVWNKINRLRLSKETGIQDEQNAWKAFVTEQWFPWAEKNAPPAFMEELELMGGIDLLTGMIN